MDQRLQVGKAAKSVLHPGDAPYQKPLSSGASAVARPGHKRILHAHLANFRIGSPVGYERVLRMQTRVSRTSEQPRALSERAARECHLRAAPSVAAGFRQGVSRYSAARGVFAQH